MLVVSSMIKFPEFFLSSYSQGEEKLSRMSTCLPTTLKSTYPVYNCGLHSFSFLFLFFSLLLSRTLSENISVFGSN